uniref:Unannotated protein n=1 Tax=freshwater metagenome TaxID=449393 RepID=A0A6J5ZHN5_9ZZZZ
MGKECGQSSRGFALTPGDGQSAGSRRAQRALPEPVAGVEPDRRPLGRQGAADFAVEPLCNRGRRRSGKEGASSRAGSKSAGGAARQRVGQPELEDGADQRIAQERDHQLLGRRGHRPRRLDRSAALKGRPRERCRRPDRAQGDQARDRHKRRHRHHRRADHPVVHFRLRGFDAAADHHRDAWRRHRDQHNHAALARRRRTERGACPCNDDRLGSGD